MCALASYLAFFAYSHRLSHTHCIAATCAAPCRTNSCVAHQVAPIPPVTGGTGTVSTTIIVPYQYDYLFQFGNSIVLSGLSLGVQVREGKVEVYRT